MSTISGLSSAVAAMPQAMSGASMRTSPQQKMSTLFQQIDTAGSGRITKAQFMQAFNNMNPPAALKAIGAEAVFGKLDPNGAGSVSKQDFISGMKPQMVHGHHRHHKEAGVEAHAAPVPQTLANSIAALNAVSNTAAPAANGVVGNTINLSA